jgi:DNA polymerase IV
MNMAIDRAGVGWLFLDLNAFFASCQQQDDPALRGRPIIVTQMLVDSTSAIASSYEAKAFGIKTGTRVSEAKRLCPEVVIVKAKHQRYSHYQERVLEAVGTCVPVEKVMSIDELACKLMGREREIPSRIRGVSA